MKECLSSDVLDMSGLNGNEMCEVFKAVVSENLTLVSQETPIVYVDDLHQVKCVKVP